MRFQNGRSCSLPDLLQQGEETHPFPLVAASMVKAAAQADVAVPIAGEMCTLLGSHVQAQARVGGV